LTLRGLLQPMVAACWIGSTFARLQLESSDRRGLWKDADHHHLCVIWMQEGRRLAMTPGGGPWQLERETPHHGPGGGGLPDDGGCPKGGKGRGRRRSWATAPDPIILGSLRPANHLTFLRTLSTTPTSGCRPIRFAPRGDGRDALPGAPGRRNNALSAAVVLTESRERRPSSSARLFLLGSLLHRAGFTDITTSTTVAARTTTVRTR
jgi:hypothetical protein